MDFKHDILPLKNIIFRTALRIILNREEAEDIVQDTLLKLWEKRGELDKVDNLEAFALTMARNLAIDRKEKMDNQHVSFDDETHDRPDEGQRTDGKLTQKETQGFVANIINSLNALCGKPWSQQDKQLLGNPYSQFLKLQFELANKFKLTDKTQLATRVQLGSIFTYGNSRYAPYSELFYAGGANSIRAFGTHTIGPGHYYDSTGRNTYLDQAGDFKAEANVEYRFNIVSNLNGALFLDAGNVWNLRSDDSHPQGKLGDGGFFNSIAVGTGFGLRYDLEFLVLRLDLGIGIHAPYDTGKSGYYNIPKFKDGLGLHFAVGYPF